MLKQIGGGWSEAVINGVKRINVGGLKGQNRSGRWLSWGDNPGGFIGSVVGAKNEALFPCLVVYSGPAAPAWSQSPSRGPLNGPGRLIPSGASTRLEGPPPREQRRSAGK